MQALPLICDRCGRHCRRERGSISTGYGISQSGARHCFQCCAVLDREAMIETGRATLYLANREIINWPGTLRFPVRGHVSRGRHNIARYQYTAYFQGPDGATWIARQYGDNTQVAHCRRLKA